MPRLPIDYSKTIMYKLVHKDDLDDVNIYVGHTTNFTERKRAHKTTCNNFKRKEYFFNVYRFIRDNGGWGEWEMLKIEDYPCKDVYEAKNRERYWIKELKPILNTNEPCRTEKEWRTANTQRLKEYNDKYKEENKEQYKKLYKKWYEINGDKKNERKREKVECDKCKNIVSRNYLTEHKKTLKCQNHGSQ